MDEIDEALARLDPTTADTAGPVVESLMGVDETRVPLSTLNQSDVQHLLWHALPSKWFVDDAEHHEMAWALGDFLESAGLDRYAAICRDPRTHEILSAWHVDPDAGAAACLQAQRDSGLVPPDTDALTFGEVMGSDEARVNAGVAVLLEKRILAGHLDPAERGFRARSRRLVEAHLRTPALEYDGRSPLSVVHEERIGFWLHRMDRTPNQLWSSVAPLVVGAPEVPEGAELSLAPALAVLEAVGDGVALTGAGYLPAKLALELDERFGWSEDMIGARPRGESQIPRLMFVDEHLRARRLLTKRGNRLSVSAEGRRCLADPARLWRTLTADRSKHAFESDILAVMAAVLLAGTSVRWDDLDDQVVAVLAGKWRAPNGVPVGPEDVHWTEVEWYRLGLSFGWWGSDHGYGLRGLRMNEVGRAAAVSLFRSVATRPMRR